MNTFLAIAIFIVQGVKYPSHYAEKFFQTIIDVLPTTNFDNFKIYDLLFGYNYFSKCIRDFDSSLNKQMVNNFAIFEMC